MKKEEKRMNKNQVINRLSDDIDSIKLPPISENVRRAVRERKNTETVNDVLSSDQLHKITAKRYIIAAAILLAVVSVPVIIVFTNNNDTFIPAENPVSERSEIITDTSEDKTISTVNNDNALERIKSDDMYGKVVQSCKSKEYLEQMFVTYSEKSIVYEDDNYIYNFDPDGRLVEMRNITSSEESSEIVTEQEILSKAKELLKKYYLYWKEDTYSIEVEGDADCRPAWIVDISRTNDDMTKEKIAMSFYADGSIKMIIMSGADGNAGSISKAEAIDIAIKEIKNGNHNICSFEKENVEITVEIRSIDGQKYYYVIVDKIHFNYDSYYIMGGMTGIVNAETGEVVVIE